MLRKVIVGHDFKFARNKEGNIKLLQQLSNRYGFDLEVVNPIKLDDIRVSSTYIRNLILNGNIENVYRIPW